MASTWSWCLRDFGRHLPKSWLPLVYDASRGQSKCGNKNRDSLSRLVVRMLYAMNFAGLDIGRYNSDDVCYL